jgi:hypothetical protein
MNTTTLNEIRSHRPCEELWEKLLEGLGKTKADDEPLPYSTILKVCGLDDTLWAIVCCHPRGLRICAEFALWCAEGVRDRMTDPSLIAILDIARRYLDGNARRAEFRRTQTEVRVANCAADRAAAFAADCVETARGTDYVAYCAAPYADAVDAAAYADRAAADAAHAADCAGYAADCAADWDAARTAQSSKLLGMLEEMQ